MKYDIITIGGAVQDQFIYTNEGVLINNAKDKLRQKLLGFEYGAKILVDHSEESFGGGAANAAVACSRLGLRVAALVAVGKDQRGKEICKNFKNNKISTSLVQLNGQEPTGYSVVVVGSDGEHVVFPVRGANNGLRINWKTRRHLGKSHWLYLTSLSGDWQKTLEDIFSNRSRAQVAWNPGHVQLTAGYPLLKPYLKNTSVLILNIDEALELASSLPESKKKKFSETAEDLAKLIQGLGPKLVVVTNDSAGATAFDGKLTYYFKPKKINKVINTIGVGDAFGSTLIAGLYLFNDVNKALELAGMNAAHVVSGHGAQPNLMYKKQIYG